MGEFRIACQVGEKRAPVPSDEPTWCDESTGLCDVASCRNWWRKAHEGKPEPWIDDREEYDFLKEACHWIKDDPIPGQELNEYQHFLQEKTLADKQQFCNGNW